MIAHQPKACCESSAVRPEGRRDIRNALHRLSREPGSRGEHLAVGGDVLAPAHLARLMACWTTAARPDGGYTDLAYAVGVDPHKLPRVLAPLRRGVTLRLLPDSTEQAWRVAEAFRQAGIPLPAQIETGGHRGGLKPDAPALVGIGRILDDAGCLDGVPTHAGESRLRPRRGGTAPGCEERTRHRRRRGGARLPDLPAGTRLRILPDHACATAAQHHGYHVVDGTRASDTGPAIEGTWKRVTGW